MKENEALALKANKGNAAAIMKVDDYIEKTKFFLVKNNIKEVNKDLTQCFHRQIKEPMKNSNFLFTVQETRERIVMNPQPPVVRAQHEVHKENIPIRPVVNSRKSPAFHLNKKLFNILKKTHF